MVREGWMEAVVVGGCDVTLNETSSDWRKKYYDAPASETMMAGWTGKSKDGC